MARLASVEGGGRAVNFSRFVGERDSIIITMPREKIPSCKDSHFQRIASPSEGGLLLYYLRVRQHVARNCYSCGLFCSSRLFRPCCEIDPSFILGHTYSKGAV